jgi:hypothetical protein
MIESEYMRKLLVRASSEIPNLRLFRRNVGALKVSERRMFRSGIPGQCDLYGYERGTGRVVEIEIKNVRGRLTQAQERWRDWCREWGIPWVLCDVSLLDPSPDATVTRWIEQIREAMKR